MKNHKNWKAKTKKNPQTMTNRYDPSAADFCYLPYPQKGNAPIHIYAIFRSLLLGEEQCLTKMIYDLRLTIYE
jgi:hypothetical protein